MKQPVHLQLATHKKISLTASNPHFFMLKILSEAHFHPHLFGFSAPPHSILKMESGTNGWAALLART
jgi:hypothetical protein